MTNTEIKDDGVINIDAIKDSMDELMALYHSKASAAETYTEAVNAVSEKSGCSKKVLRKLVTARCNNTDAEEVAEAEELATLIEEVA